MDRNDASMPVQPPKKSVLKSYGYFSIVLRKPSVSGRTFVVIVLFLDWSGTKIAGLPTTASKNANGAENGGSYAKKEFDQIANVSNGSPDFDRHLWPLCPRPHAARTCGTHRRSAQCTFTVNRSFVLVHMTNVVCHGWLHALELSEPPLRGGWDEEPITRSEQGTVIRE